MSLLAVAEPDFRAPVEDDEHAQVLVRGEPVVCACLDEGRVSFTNQHRLAFDFEDPGPLEDDVHLVVGVRLLPVRSGATST